MHSARVVGQTQGKNPTVATVADLQLHREFDLADQCLESLHRKLKQSNPSTIITACAECLEALLRIKARFHEDFEVLTVLEYLMRYKENF